MKKIVLKIVNKYLYWPSSPEEWGLTAVIAITSGVGSFLVCLGLYGIWELSNKREEQEDVCD
jgi:hypothetical protein